MKKSDFHYDLPSELIAQHPPATRSASRLLHLPAVGVAENRQIRDLPSLLRPGDLLIFNDTRVIKARLYGRKPSGGKVEILIERVIDARTALAQIGASKTPKAGSEILISGTDTPVQVIDRENDLFRLKLEAPLEWSKVLETSGQLPLPPYIEHPAGPQDESRYQTLFARDPGAVAAPTAGLHFDRALLDALWEKGIGVATITLHVGAGTFQPMRVEQLAEHRMHAEVWMVPNELPARVAAVRKAGGRIVAVGTTVVRTLESALDESGQLRAGRGQTRLFITPGYRIRSIDLLLTNFHLPQSTLMMLVCAFGGYERMMQAYAFAVHQRYRFFSYGDAMLIAPPET